MTFYLDCVIQSNSIHLLQILKLHTVLFKRKMNTYTQYDNNNFYFKIRLRKLLKNNCRIELHQRIHKF